MKPLHLVTKHDVKQGKTKGAKSTETVDVIYLGSDLSRAKSAFDKERSKGDECLLRLHQSVPARITCNPASQKRIADMIASQDKTRAAKEAKLARKTLIEQRDRIAAQLAAVENKLSPSKKKEPSTGSGR